MVLELDLEFKSASDSVFLSQMYFLICPSEILLNLGDIQQEEEKFF